jgi:predicted O-methyltransferase YrrM
MDFDFLHAVKGFMADEEATRLHDLALAAAPLGPILEIGSYCGLSAAVIGWACKQTHSTLFSIDHHTGSEEQQPGEQYFDPDLFDKTMGQINTLPFLLKTIKTAGLGDYVVPMVCASTVAGRMWRTPLSMVFIDGGHSFDAVYQDFLTWSPHVMANGLLVFHDIFLDPALGGQAPRQVYDIALQTGDYIELPMTNTLGVLQQKPV